MFSHSHRRAANGGRAGLTALVALVAAAFLYPALAGSPAAGGTHAQPAKVDLIVETDNGVFIVDQASGAHTPAKDVIPGSVVAPDGSRLAFIRRVGESDELFVAELDPAGGPLRNERRLTNGAGNARDPQWTPDGNGIVYVRGSFEQAQIYRSDLTAARPTETRISGGQQQSWLPRIAPDGTIAYVVLTGREGKRSFTDLIVQKGREKKTLVSGESISAIAFSPDGTRLAWTTHGKIVIHTLATGSDETIDFLKAIHEKLHAHHVRSLAWHPDGSSLAMIINFSGGRAAPLNAGPGYEFPPILGDREVFIVAVPAPGASDDAQKAKSFTLPDDTNSVAWRSR